MTTSVDLPTAQGWIADDATFGARLALVRQRMGWTNVKEAATECGLPAENWRRWERGEAEPRRLVTIAMTIATRAGCDYLWLVHGPQRGGTIPTHKLPEYFPQTRVIASIKPNRMIDPSPRGRPDSPPPPGRPVRQTRPLAGQSVRPHTPVAV